MDGARFSIRPDPSLSVATDEDAKRDKLPALGPTPKTPLVPIPKPVQLTKEQVDGYIHHLTPSQYRFVQEYLVDFDPARAYITVYSNVMGAREAGKRILRHPKVQTAIAMELQKAGERLFLKKEALVQRLWSEALNMESRAAERIKALEMIGRMIGALNENGEDKRGKAPIVQVTFVQPQQAAPDPLAGEVIDIKVDGKPIVGEDGLIPLVPLNGDE